MRHYATLMNQSLSRRAGRVLKAYKYFSPTISATYANGYSATEASPATFTEVGNGVYYLDVTNTFKATIGIVDDDSTFTVLHLGVILEGDNEASLVPPST